MQTLSDPPAARELAQVLDPDGAAFSFRLVTSGDETTAHPTGRFGWSAILFLGFIGAVIAGVLCVQAVGMWRKGDNIVAVILFAIVVFMLPAAAGSLVHILKHIDKFQLVHGPFARWNRTAGTFELPRLGVTLQRAHK